jgi:hypothetical protein
MALIDIEINRKSSRDPYSTNFSLTENPISEAGAWISGTTTPNEAPIRTSGGLAYGTQNGHEQQDSGLYNDSHAFLSGVFPVNQRASGVIRVSAAAANLGSQGNLEVELLLRMSIGPLQTGLLYGDTAEYGYEINMGQGVFGTFIQIGRWKRLGLFDSLISGSPLTSMGVHDGDIFLAECIETSPGNINITVKLNGTTIASASDTTSWLPAIGTPGIGQYRHDTTGTIDPTCYCLTSFNAVPL